MDDRVVEAVADAFRKHPWVERVVSVRKDLALGLTATIDYRRPVAAVVLEGDRYVIDHKAVLLPPLDGGEADDLPRIQNVRSVPQGPAGTVWDDPAVQGAARLAAVLLPSWKKLELEAILISDAGDGDPPAEGAVYRLQAGGGTRIIWGRAPGADQAGELTPEQKIGRLEDYQARRGGFGNANSPLEIDIRHWQEIGRRPLSHRAVRPRS